MHTSRHIRSKVKNNSNKRLAAEKCIGLCKHCGRRISLCGRLFTADIECSKCHYINMFRRSQQPVSAYAKDSNDINGVH